MKKAGMAVRQRGREHRLKSRGREQPTLTVAQDLVLPLPGTQGQGSFGAEFPASGSGSTGLVQQLLSSCSMVAMVKFWLTTSRSTRMRWACSRHSCCNALGSRSQ